MEGITELKDNDNNPKKILLLIIAVFILSSFAFTTIIITRLNNRRALLDKPFAAIPENITPILTPTPTIIPGGSIEYGRFDLNNDSYINAVDTGTLVSNCIFGDNEKKKTCWPDGDFSKPPLNGDCNYDLKIDAGDTSCYGIRISQMGNLNYSSLDLSIDKIINKSDVDQLISDCIFGDNEKKKTCWPDGDFTKPPQNGDCNNDLIIDAGDISCFVFKINTWVQAIPTPTPSPTLPQFVEITPMPYHYLCDWGRRDKFFTESDVLPLFNCIENYSFCARSDINGDEEYNILDLNAAKKCINNFNAYPNCRLIDFDAPFNQITAQEYMKIIMCYRSSCMTDPDRNTDLSINENDLRYCYQHFYPIQKPLSSNFNCNQADWNGDRLITRYEIENYMTNMCIFGKNQNELKYCWIQGNNNRPNFMGNVNNSGSQGQEVDAGDISAAVLCANVTPTPTPTIDPYKLGQCDLNNDSKINYSEISDINISCVNRKAVNKCWNSVGAYRYGGSFSGRSMGCPFKGDPNKDCKVDNLDIRDCLMLMLQYY